MKTPHASSLVSVFLLFSAAAAIPAIRPGSTTLSPLPEPVPQGQSQPIPFSNSTSVPIPLSTGAVVQEDRPEEEPFSEATPTLTVESTQTSASESASPTFAPESASPTFSPAASPTAVEMPPQRTSFEMSSQPEPSPSEGRSFRPESTPAPLPPQTMDQSEPGPQGNQPFRQGNEPVPQGGRPVPQSDRPSPQGNICQTGDSFCCDEKQGRNTCIKANTSCDQKVICCNNSNGYQFCVGDINFNMPITFDIDINIEF